MIDKTTETYLKSMLKEYSYLCPQSEAKASLGSMKLNEMKFCAINASKLVETQTIELKAGMYRVITNATVKGKMVDTLLYVKDSNGVQVAYNDDESGVNAKLTLNVIKEGVYTIEVKTFGSVPANFLLYVCSEENYRAAGLK